MGEGRIDNLKGSNTSRGQWVHHVSVAALSILLEQAYEQYCERVSPQQALSFENWCSFNERHHPQFLYWSITLQLEKLLLLFLKAQRQANFDLYVATLGRRAGRFFTMDHYHYARWLSVHVKDLMQISVLCPSAYTELSNGKFLTHKTANVFSALAHDQVHEQLNAVLKGDRGIVGITKANKALRRWMVTGPEVVRMLAKYENKHLSFKTSSHRHHEQNQASQGQFLSSVKDAIAAFEDVGNPFQEESADLITLDTKVMM